MNPRAESRRCRFLLTFVVALTILALSVLALPAAAAAAPTPPGVTLGTVTLANGVTLQYAESGHGRGQAVIFLHGYTDSWFSFSRVMAAMPARYHCFALSQRGHGDSDRPLSGYASSDFAADVIAFMDALGLRKADLVGHSMGSVIAQRVALDYWQRVGKLVLIGSAADVTINPVLLDLETFVDTLSDPIDPAFVHDFQASTVFQPIPQDFLDTVVAESLKVPARVWKDALAGLLAENTLPELAQLAAPTLILWGDKDEIFPFSPDQLDLDLGIPRSELVIYADTGHGLHWEQPGRTAADVAAFLQKTEPPKPGSNAGALSIAAARQLPLGTGVTVEGSVIVPSGAFASSTFDQGFGVQDATAGLYVSLATDLGLTVPRRVRVSGVLDDDGFGILVLRPAATSDVTLLSGAVPVAAAPVASGDVGEATEGSLVQVEGVITRPLGDDTPFGYSVFVDDGSGETQVFIPLTTGVDPFQLGYMQPGRRIRATGQSGQFLGQYEVLPRFAGDLQPAP